MSTFQEPSAFITEEEYLSTAYPASISDSVASALKRRSHSYIRDSIYAELPAVCPSDGYRLNEAVQIVRGGYGDKRLAQHILLPKK